MKYRIEMIKLQQRINSLENENETLKNIIKEELYTEFMEYVDVRTENNKLKAENKKIKDKLRSYQAQEYRKEKKNGK